MSTLSETGHARNAARFDELIESITTFSYDPAKESLKLESMKTMSKDCMVVLKEVSRTLALYKAAVDARQPMFEMMNRHISRILSILQSSDVSAETIETFKSIARKISGRRATPGKSLKEDSAEGIEVRSISSSQRSYDNQLENFNLFIEQLIGTPGYKPNETELKPEYLQKMAEDLKKKNADVVSARTALKDARGKRDNLMYRKESGLIDVALDAKAYIRGAFGPSSSEFRKVSKLEFRRN